MTTIDLTPLYRSSIGFDRLGSLLNSALDTEQPYSSYPPYNIEVKAENEYQISLAVAGFTEGELDIQTERGVLTIRGKKATTEEKRQYLHQGIANRSFERKFNLADHVEVTDAELVNGLLIIQLVKELPEAMKPKKIPVNGVTGNLVEEQSGDVAA